MKCKRTDLFVPNVRRETVPNLEEEQYTALLFDEEVDVSAEAGEYLVHYHYAEEVE